MKSMNPELEDKVGGDRVGKEGERREERERVAYPPPDPTINSWSLALRMRSVSPVHLNRAGCGTRANRNVSPVPKNWASCLSRRSLAMNAPNTCNGI